MVSIWIPKWWCIKESCWTYCPLTLPILTFPTSFRLLRIPNLARPRLQLPSSACAICAGLRWVFHPTFRCLFYRYHNLVFTAVTCPSIMLVCRDCLLHARSRNKPIAAGLSQFHDGASKSLESENRAHLVPHSTASYSILKRPQTSLLGFNFCWRMLRSIVFPLTARCCVPTSTVATFTFVWKRYKLSFSELLTLQWNSFQIMVWRETSWCPWFQLKKRGLIWRTFLVCALKDPKL